MKFDEQIKDALTEVPSRGWNKDLSDAVLQAVQRNGAIRTHSTSRLRASRRRSTVQGWAAAFVGVCVMGGLLANAVGMVPWHGLAANKGGLTAHDTSSRLQLYSGTVLQPVGAAPLLPSLTTAETNTASMLPVVRVSATYGVDAGAIDAPPKQALATVPGSVANRMAAYYVPISRFDAFYLIGPKAMKGKLSVGADGSFTLALKNQDAFIEVDGPGGSGVSAAGIAAPFFANARTFLKTAITTAKPTPLGNTAIKRVTPQLAEFAFNTEDRQQTTGFCFNQMVDGRLIGPFGESTLFVYQSSQQDADLGKWIMNTALSALRNIGEPQLSGDEVQSAATTVDISGRRVKLYVPPGKAPFAVRTPSGIAWIAYPPYIDHHQTLAGRTPAGTYNMMLSPLPKSSAPTPTQGRSLFSIPGYRVPDATNMPSYAYPTSLQVVANRWLLYTLMYAGVGMNQPADNELRAYDLKTGKEERITSFHIAGGTFFAMGVSGNNVVYDQSSIADAQGNITHYLVLVNLATGQTTHLPSTDLVHNTVVTKLSGKTVSIPLRQFP